MIERLRKRFIRIATLAVAGVMFLLCLIVNTANFISVNNSLNDMLTMISNNQGSIPPFRKIPANPWTGKENSVRKLRFPLDILFWNIPKTVP